MVSATIEIISCLLVLFGTQLIIGSLDLITLLDKILKLRLHLLVEHDILIFSFLNRNSDLLGDLEWPFIAQGI
jgi:hypothetical protein